MIRGGVEEAVPGNEFSVEQLPHELLGGVSAISSNRFSQFGPSLGATVRVGIPVISAELAAIYTPVGFRQLDARAELVLRLLILELRGGYRARWIEMVGPDRFTMPVEPTGGLSVSAGLVF